MLARDYRLPATVKLRNSRFLKTPNWSLKYAKNDAAVNRYGFVIRKSADKRAVVRNRIRRVFRSCIEELHQDMVQGNDMLFFLEKGIMDMNREALMQQITLMLRKNNLVAQK